MLLVLLVFVNGVAVMVNVVEVNVLLRFMKL